MKFVQHIVWPIIDALGNGK